MLTAEDKLYQQFGSIIFKTLGSYSVHEPRFDIEFPEKQYYVFGICYPNFLPPDKYEKSKDFEYYSTLKRDDPDMFEIYNNLAKDDLTIDVLSDLNAQLKEAGAKRIWLHHSKEYDKKLNTDAYISTKYGEMLLVIDVDEENVFGEMNMINSRNSEQIEIFSTKYIGKDAFDGVLCNYFNGCHCYRERTSIFTDKTYCVIGVNAPNFIHSKNYDPTKDIEYIESLKKESPKMAEKYPSYFAIMFSRHHPTLDHFIEVSNYLKRAGDKQIWISPAEKYDEKTGHIIDDSYGEIGTFLITIEN